MEIKTKALDLFKRYKYVLLVLAAGVLLMLIPGKASEVKTTSDSPQPVQTGQEDLAGELEALIGKMEGAGKAQVLLTLDYGPQSIYQTDQHTKTQEGSWEQETTTVLYQSSGSDKLPVVTQVRYPVYKGAVVVCQGGDRGTVKLAIVEAVSSLTGLGSDKITVIKMKGQ